jgi:sulfur-oxidizing protein SoxA
LALVGAAAWSPWAEAYPYDAVEYAALRIYLIDRAKGMVFELPGVRP